VRRVLDDFRSAPIGEAERAILEFIDRVNSATADIARSDVEAAKEAGWSEEALYDAITVCALFNFYNRWCDAAGVHDLPEGAYRAAAKHMGARGYRIEV
jgi:alkylhydroperoxidase family enzyme